MKKEALRIQIDILNTKLNMIMDKIGISKEERNKRLEEVGITDNLEVKTNGVTVKNTRETVEEPNESEENKL